MRSRRRQRLPVALALLALLVQFAVTFGHQLHDLPRHAGAVSSHDLAHRAGAGDSDPNRSAQRHHAHHDHHHHDHHTHRAPRALGSIDPVPLGSTDRVPEEPHNDDHNCPTCWTKVLLSSAVIPALVDLFELDQSVACAFKVRSFVAIARHIDRAHPARAPPLMKSA